MKKRGMHMKKTNMNLIPDCENQTPDYYCTWQTQLYATNDGKPKMQRQILGEKALFAQEKPFGWAYFYPDARRDLYFVMDDSWDVPPDGDESYYGSLVLNKEKFPESVGGKQSNAEALLSLTERIKSLGWKGLGGWVCAQESERFDGKKYWETRFQDANFSGFSMGIMRHPYQGNFMNGKADLSFPAVHRNLKSKICEVTRAARWHRIAPAFAMDGVHVSEKLYSDSWRFENTEEEMEQWWFSHPFMEGCIRDWVLTKKAPAAISRNMELPQVLESEHGMEPYLVASKNPNGVCAVAALGRTSDRTYRIPACDVLIDCHGADTVGVFGEYRTLHIKGVKPLSAVLIQDLAGECAFDVTEKIHIESDRIIIPGELIHQIGTSCNPAGDTSEPGVIIKLI